MGRLLAEGVDISLTDTQSRTALLHSVILKHESVTDLLLTHHSSLVRKRLNTRGKSGEDLIWRSSAQGDDGLGYNCSEGESRAGGGIGVPDDVSDIQVGMARRIELLFTYIFW